jgi:hypothetical protein
LFHQSWNKCLDKLETIVRDSSAPADFSKNAQ